MLNIDNIKIQEFNLREQIGFDFWHTNILDKNMTSIAAGFGASKELSRGIAYSEYLERNQFKKIKSLEQKNCESWGLDIIPTGCGFAAGFNLKNTILRSIGESLERWTMSKWIDDLYTIDLISDTDVLKIMDPVSKWFYDQFDSVEFYKKTIVICYNQDFLKFDVGFTIAYKDNGVFPGSAYNYGESNLWQHALLESYRHLLVFNNNEMKSGFPDNKVRFFGKNAKVAREQIRNANKKDWPIPVIEFHKTEYNEENCFFLARTIIKGWTSWNLGPLERFLY